MTHPVSRQAWWVVQRYLKADAPLYDDKYIKQSAVFPPKKAHPQVNNLRGGAAIQKFEQNYKPKNLSNFDRKV